MKIINAKVYTEAGIFEEREVCTDKEWISETSTDDVVLDGTGCYLIPGLTDVHFHGCVGKDFCDGSHESIEAMAVYEASQGILNFYVDYECCLCRGDEDVPMEHMESQTKGR